MKTGVQLLGSCRRLLRAVSMIEKYGDGSRMVNLHVYVLSGGSAAGLSSSLRSKSFLLYPVSIVWCNCRDVAVAIVLSK